MLLRCIASGSKGNSYALISDNEILLIEAGVRLLEVKKAIDFQVSKVVGCLISHVHGDHAKYADEYARAGIQLYRPYDDDSPAADIGGFKVVPFSLVHDVPCYGFWIHHDAAGNIIYATDTEYIKYRFSGEYTPNHILVEANYSSDIVNPKMPNWKHILEGHMELKTTLNFLEANRSPRLMEVVLCHLSDRNSNARQFKEAAEKVTGCPIYLAEPGLEVELTDSVL